MERRGSRVALAMAALIGLSACDGARDPPRAAASADDGWVRPPTILAARPASETVVVSGLAEPGSRVVLRDPAGPVYATAAGQDGRFELPVAVSGAPQFLRPEVQVGQEAMAAADLLLILDQGRGPMVVLRPGESARRLDRVPAGLAAVDTDGRRVIASGAASAPFLLTTAAREVRVTPSQGRWRVLLDPGEAARLRIEQVDYAWPGAGAGAPSVERLAGGWRIDWAWRETAQSTWLPTA